MCWLMSWSDPLRKMDDLPAGEGVWEVGYVLGKMSLPSGFFGTFDWKRSRKSSIALRISTSLSCPRLSGQTKHAKSAWKLWTGQASGKCEDLLVFNSIEKTCEIFIHIEHAYNHTSNFREREWVVTPFICISVISPTAKEHASLIVSGLRNRCWKKTYHDQPAS